MAAHPASDRTFADNTVGVVTNGSPIDSFDILRDVPVHAFPHLAEVVPTLDGNAFDETPPNGNRVLMPGPASPLDTHNDTAYANSVAVWEAHYAARGSGPPPGLDLFTGEVVDHSVFTTHE
ncbi:MULTISPECIES: hypothetical protein [Microbacterium]|uniref:hypothetical protein n=1 Tax=Microbacterium TaxID=33882 RepID=UPI0011C021B5|nr:MULTISPECIES: hypothetical protein [Microbacterium]WJS89420.1 hypothetical protein NYQ11_08625 [Microbacterium testaceum]